MLVAPPRKRQRVPRIPPPAEEAEPDDTQLSTPGTQLGVKPVSGEEGGVGNAQTARAWTRDFASCSKAKKRQENERNQPKNATTSAKTAKTSESSPEKRQKTDPKMRQNSLEPRKHPRKHQSALKKKDPRQLSKHLVSTFRSRFRV